jgi:hypothetical protein
MEARRFDALTVELATGGQSRRRVVTSAVSGALALGLAALRVSQAAAAAPYPQCCKMRTNYCKRQCRQQGAQFGSYDCAPTPSGDTCSQQVTCFCGNPL